MEAFAEKTATLEANNQRLTEVNTANLNTITELNQSFEEIRENFNQVQSDFQSIREQNNELKERLGRHELGALASARPQLVERTINSASENALRCFELLSGAPLTESEKMQQMLDSLIRNALSYGLVLLTSLFLLSACSKPSEFETTPIVEVRTVETKKPAPIVPDVDQIRLRSVNWKVITPDNADGVFASLPRDAVLFALTANGLKHWR